MKIIDTDSSRFNLYVVKCDCGTQFKSRADNFRMRCPKCDKSEKTSDLRKHAEILDSMVPVSVTDDFEDVT